MSPRSARETPAPRQAAEPPATPRPAATVVLLRPGPGGLEVLLIRRPARMAFGPNIHAFPGGRVEPTDAAPSALGATGITPERASASLGHGLAPDGEMTPVSALAHHVAAARETREEVGVEIAAQDLIALSRWVTPPSMARRFDTRFFAVFVPPDTQIRADPAEVAEARWVTPGRALEAATRGEIELWQPTFVTLQQLDGLDDAAAVRAAFEPGPVAGGPILEPAGPTTVRVDAAWAGGIPGRRTIGWLVGERDLVVVDPADPTGVTTDAMLEAAAARSGRLVGVVVTDLVPERHAGVELLAHGLGLPVAVAAGGDLRAPYPIVELDPLALLPFGDGGLTLAGVVRLE